MKRFFTASLLFASISAMAISPNDIKAPESYGNTFVSDAADVLSPDKERALDDELVAYYEATGNQVAVFTTQDTSDSDSPRTFANKLFEIFEFGDADKDNGLLILLSIDDRRVEFETGYGLEGLLPDVTLFRIQQEHMIPEFKMGDYEQGLIEGTQATLGELTYATAKEEAYLNNLPIPVDQDHPPEPMQHSSAFMFEQSDDGESYFLYFLILSLFGGTVAGLYLITSHKPKQSSGSSARKSFSAAQTPEIKTTCRLCKSVIPSSTSSKNAPDYFTSPFEHRLSALGVATTKALECTSCGYFNANTVITKPMSRCGECKNKAEYILYTARFSLANYLNVYVDGIDRTAPLGDKTFKAVIENWREEEKINFTASHCYMCNRLSGALDKVTVIKSPVVYAPKPSQKIVKHTSPSPSGSGTKTTWSSSSSSGSSSRRNTSKRHSRPKPKPKPRSRGGRSGGGGAGSSW